jgi:hypothetical protein
MIKVKDVKSLAEVEVIGKPVLQLTLWEGGFLYDGKLTRPVILKMLVGLFAVMKHEGVTVDEVIDDLSVALSRTYWEVVLSTESK